MDLEVAVREVVDVPQVEDIESAVCDVIVEAHGPHETLLLIELDCTQ